jgi:hypothetical protein
MRANLRAQALAGPLTGKARVLARRKDVLSLQTYSDHSIDKHARLREQSRGRGTGTRSLPALGPARAQCLPDRYRVGADTPAFFTNQILGLLRAFTRDPGVSAFPFFDELPKTGTLF